jgi:ABC-type transport system involved in Fe-S cluster assembly fused permease/ATPase subunit
LAGFDRVVEIFVWNLTSFVVGFVTISIALFGFGWKYGLVAIVSLFLLAWFTIWANLKRTETFNPISNLADDEYKQISTETLQQAPYIRATFGTNEQVSSLSQKAKWVMVTAGNSWQGGTYINFITRNFYLIILTVLAGLAFADVQAGQMTIITATTLIISYINGSDKILTLGSSVKNFSKGLADINDLWNFIRNFGQQTYPVLTGDRIESNPHS